MASTITSMDALFRDMYPRPGERIKQWVVDSRREAAWERTTCPLIMVESHRDNTDAECRNVGVMPWTFLDHDCCYVCNELQDATEKQDDVQTWLAERAKRPSIEANRSKLSDEVQPEIDWSVLADHPFLRRR